MDFNVYFLFYFPVMGFYVFFLFCFRLMEFHVCLGMFAYAQPAVTYTKLTIETLEQDVKYVQS